MLSSNATSLSATKLKPSVKVFVLTMARPKAADLKLGCYFHYFVPFTLEVHYKPPVCCRIGLTDNKAKLTYEGFLRAFEEGRPDQYPPAPEDVTSYRVFDHLTPEKAEEKLRKYVTDQSAALTAVRQIIILDYT